MQRLRALSAPLDRYIALRDLLAADQRAYYALLLSHTEEILPFVYTVRPRWLWVGVVGAGAKMMDGPTDGRTDAAALGPPERPPRIQHQPPTLTITSPQPQRQRPTRSRPWATRACTTTGCP